MSEGAWFYVAPGVRARVVRIKSMGEALDEYNVERKLRSTSLREQELRLDVEACRSRSRSRAKREREKR